MTPELSLLSTIQATTYLLMLKEPHTGDLELKAGKTTEATTSSIRTLKPDTMKKLP